MHSFGYHACKRRVIAHLSWAPGLLPNAGVVHPAQMLPKRSKVSLPWWTAYLIFASGVLMHVVRRLFQVNGYPVMEIISLLVAGALLAIGASLWVRHPRFRAPSKGGRNA